VTALKSGFSQFAQNLQVEVAFSVLAAAKTLKAAGKDVIELEIGDSPFPAPDAAKEAGLEAIRTDQSRYCPSMGLPELRQAAAEFVSAQFGIPASRDNVVVGPGAKPFQQFFCEAFLDPGDGVLVYSPHFPTFIPNIERRGARVWLSPLKQSRMFRPDAAAIEKFVKTDPAPKAVILNSPHNPTGGVADEADLREIAEVIRRHKLVLFSDEPYCHMVWTGEHRSMAALPGMLDHAVAAFTFSKSYSMSGYRLGFAVAASHVARKIGDLINTSLSCTPPIMQLAGLAALKQGSEHSQQTMRQFASKVRLLTNGLNRIDGFHALSPAATFYVFPNVKPLCNRLGISSHGLAMYLLEAADERTGVACLGGECFGAAGAGFLRFSCAESDDRLLAACNFIEVAVRRVDRVAAFLGSHPRFRLSQPYVEER
jgi:aspartate aminotransferase